MTQPAQPSVPGLAVRAPALEPDWVRHGSATVQKDYQAALEFEQMLVTQMASSLTQNGELAGGGSGEEGSGESQPGAGIYSSMLPQALASSVVSGGGLGIAAELTRQLAPNADAAPHTGGTGAA